MKFKFFFDNDLQISVIAFECDKNLKKNIQFKILIQKFKKIDAIS
jgi:hypothetical protein